MYQEQEPEVGVVHEQSNSAQTRHRQRQPRIKEERRNEIHFDELCQPGAPGLLDRLRLTYGARSFDSDDFGGDDFYWHLGINDVPGLAYWITQSLE